MSEPTPVSVSLKYGIPGVLLTSGMALLAISVFTPTLFSPGVTLLVLGILSFIAKRAFDLVADMADESHERSLEPWEVAVGGGYVVVLIVLAVVVLLVFWPLLPL